jgi:HK97 family phage portal protein
MSMVANTYNWLSRLFSVSLDDPKRLTEEKAMNYAPVWYGVNKICGHVGYMPLFCYKRDPNGGANKAVTHPAYRLLKSRPNAYQTATQFKAQVNAHAILWGNGRAAIIRDGVTPTELIPLLPDRTITVMVQGEKYHITKPDGDDRAMNFLDYQQGEKYVVLHDRDVLHIPGFSFDGVAGVSLVEMAKRSLCLGMNAEKTSESQLSKGFAGTVFLEAPPGAFKTQKDAEQFLDWFSERHTGPEAAGIPGLLREGIKANVLQMSNADSQFLEQRKFQRQEAAMWLGLESILGDDSSVSYNSLEQKNLAYLSGCLMNWLVKWEQECDEKLLTETQKRNDTHYFKFQTAALLRADFQTTISSLSVAIASRIINPNEAREVLERNPYEGGDTFENPAISTGSPGGPDNQPKNPAKQATKAIASRLEHLIGVEINRVTNATTQKNYCDWLDSYYDRWQINLTEAIESLGGSGELAAEHCKFSKDALLHVAGISTPDNLAPEVRVATANWKDRAQQLAEKISGY